MSKAFHFPFIQPDKNLVQIKRIERHLSHTTKEYTQYPVKMHKKNSFSKTYLTLTDSTIFQFLKNHLTHNFFLSFKVFLYIVSAERGRYLKTILPNSHCEKVAHIGLGFLHIHIQVKRNQPKERFISKSQPIGMSANIHVHG